ncbi:MAG: glycosyltransferase family 87 protein [Bacteroidetes bacterium]|nr:glycosyltransferase family 87 protein [Bacteroidota bacterium]
MNLKLKSLLLNYKFIFFIYILFAAIASIQSLILGNKIFNNGQEYTFYNNYIIFQQSFFHLVEHKDLYCIYFSEHWDLFKYSPTFPLLFGIFAIFPVWIGLPLWNLLNAAILFAAIASLPQIKSNKIGYILWFILIELFTNMQNQQSNGLIAGLIILAFSLLEKDKKLLGTFLIALSLFIKPFGLLAFVLLLFYPKKLKLAGYSILWIVILFFLPLLVVDLAQLKILYSSWLTLLSSDHSGSTGLSVFGWIQTWFGIHPSKLFVLLISVVLFIIPLFRVKQYRNVQYRLFILASILLWIVIFNHKAESPTFIIAISGVAIWCFSQAMKVENLILLIAAFIFTSLSPTDLFPRIIRNEFIEPYVIKAVPCILIWLKVIYDTTFTKFRIDTEL